LEFEELYYPEFFVKHYKAHGFREEYLKIEAEN
jgi:hypothetical protein